MNQIYKTRFVFFGSSRLSVIVLDELENLGFMPSVVVTTPDKPKGRKLAITPNPVKEWAQNREIKVFDPEKLDTAFTHELKNSECDFFVVASYGKIIPSEIINLPKFKTLNIHPSLLPKYRGASPLPSAMIDDTKETGVTIMRLDEQMDHGPIVAQKKITVSEWPIYEDFEEMMAKEGAKLLALTIPAWLEGKIKETEQDHSAATYTKKISKEDGEIDLNSDPYSNFRKIQAYHQWPQAFFFVDSGKKKIRVKITSAEFKAGKLMIKKVVPEGKKEMNYEAFMRGYL
jgi:methionyl-tRNA formyltransferase